MQCRHCGAEIEGEGRFWDECGKPLREDSAAPVQASGALGLAAKPAPTPVTPQVRSAPFPTDTRPFRHTKYNKKWNNTNYRHLALEPAHPVDSDPVPPAAYKGYRPNRGLAIERQGKG